MALPFEIAAWGSDPDSDGFGYVIVSWTRYQVENGGWPAAFTLLEMSDLDELVSGLSNEIVARANIDSQLADAVNLTNNRIDNLLYDPVPQDDTRDGKRIYLNEFVEVFSTDQVDGLEQRFALFTNALSGKISDISVSAGTGLIIDKSNMAFPVITQNKPSWSNVQAKPLTYPPSVHNHSIAEITNLSSELNNKIETSQIGVANGIPSLDGNSKIPVSQMPNFSSSLIVVSDITARDNYTYVGNTSVLVQDASADPTVVTGHAFYVYDFANSLFIKTSEQESLDLILDWNNVTGKPSNITNLQSLLDAKRNSLDPIPISDITNLQTDLNAKRNLIDNIPASEITESLSQNFVSDTEKTLWNNTALIGAVSGSTTVDLAGNRTARFILTGNIDITAINNAVQDNVYVFYFKQDATGNRTITLPATVLLPSGETPDLTVSKVSLLTMYYDGTNFLGSWKKGW